MNRTTAEKDQILLRFIANKRYSVTADGKVFSENYQNWTGKRVELRPKISQKGYQYVTLRVYGKKCYFYVHRMVALVYLGQPDDVLQINHKNGIKQDNRVENLEWVTAAGNLAHAREAGLMDAPKGDGHYNSTLTEAQVKEILVLLKNGGVTKREIESRYGVGRGVVSAIANGKSWKHIKREDSPDG